MKKYRKVMGLAIVLVALAVAINALAFKTATVQNAATFTVSATNAAALAIEADATPGTGFTTAGIGTGYLTLTIDDNMQPNSVYTFDDVFKITNKASNTTTSITGINYSLSGLDAAIATVKLLDSADGTQVSNETLASGASITVDLEITVLSTAALGAEPFEITISGNQ